jgi:hypothetical protein
MWEFAVVLLLVAILVAIVAPRFISGGPRGATADGTLLITGVSPRPDASGKQYCTIAGVINGANVDEHPTYARVVADVDNWPVIGELIPVLYSPKNPDHWRPAEPGPPYSLGPPGFDGI